MSPVCTTPSPSGSQTLRRSGSCSSSGCQIRKTFAIGSSWKADSTCTATLSVTQTGDLDDSAEYTDLYASGARVATCNQNTMSWTTPSACARVDVTKHVSSSGSLAIVLVANSEVDYGQAYDDDGANGAAVSAHFELIIRCSGKEKKCTPYVVV